MSKRAADCRSARVVLAADAQLRDDRSVPLDVLTPEVVEHPTSPSDERQQAALAVKVLLVDLHVLGQMANTLREQRDLHFGRPSVGVVQAIVADRCCLVGHTRMSLYRVGTIKDATTGHYAPSRTASTSRVICVTRSSTESNRSCPRSRRWK